MPGHNETKPLTFIQLAEKLGVEVDINNGVSSINLKGDGSANFDNIPITTSKENGEAAE
ncbi:MAG: hypothetical protein WCL07_03495 [bacterium]